MLEADACVLFEMSPQIASYREQPTRISFPDGDRSRLYIPDYQLDLTDGRQFLVEIKPARRLAAPEIRAKFDRIEEHMRRLGLSFLVLTDELIRTQPRLINLRRLRYEAPLTAVDYDAVRRSLRNRTRSELCTLGELISLLGSNVVVDLLMRGHATCSLEHPLSHDTPVNISLESKHEWFLIDERTGF
ncbi:TnsA endonuclease N-terminal domain-containing protein [Burkholderia cenocepacia]|uniref:TnsA endonuclease N-terminal domain-containing protein n=1 Tax=Burkholderia cenocepacia TaxID=95486 RepID=UPI0018DB29B8|nr:TnsA endonuclease N-terminal domain-containing protein [Burkholderia cenocepacia]